MIAEDIVVVMIATVMTVMKVIATLTQTSHLTVMIGATALISGSGTDRTHQLHTSAEVVALRDDAIVTPRDTKR